MATIFLLAVTLMNAMCTAVGISVVRTKKKRVGNKTDESHVFGGCAAGCVRFCGNVSRERSGLNIYGNGDPAFFDANVLRGTFLLIITKPLDYYKHAKRELLPAVVDQLIGFLAQILQRTRVQIHGKARAQRVPVRLQSTTIEKKRA